MSDLTTRQRDILQLLLDAEAPQGARELAETLQLTARQVNYGLKQLDSWLSTHGIDMTVRPGVGVSLDISPENAALLEKQLVQQGSFQLVLSAEQRRQLLAFALLVSHEPTITYRLQQLLQVSRSTVLKDLQPIAEWLENHNLSLTRRPNFGVSVAGPERFKRQALLALLWGEMPFGDTLFYVNHAGSIHFALQDESATLPILTEVVDQLATWDVRRMLAHVAYVEAQLGGRFTDDAVLFLALNFAVQTERVTSGAMVTMPGDQIAWLRSRTIWPIAADVARRVDWRHTQAWPDSEVAYVAMTILANPRNSRWPSDQESDATFGPFVDELLVDVAEAYELSALAHDASLRDGLLVHLIPASLRQRFKLWIPHSLTNTVLPERYIKEQQLAAHLAERIETRTGLRLQTGERNALVLLLRAAFIREYPIHRHNVVVVCPSGMATAQLLLARLQARFPGIGNLRVLSLREVSTLALSDVELVVSTVPIDLAWNSACTVIQVHPLLLPEDIDAITAWLS